MADRNLPTSSRWRLQFTIARIMACTVFVALAAWAATTDLPFAVTVSPFGKRDVLPVAVVSVLLAAAVGVLIKGKPGAIEGVRAGCALLIATTLAVSIIVSLKGWLF